MLTYLLNRVGHGNRLVPGLTFVLLKRSASPPTSPRGRQRSIWRYRPQRHSTRLRPGHRAGTQEIGEYLRNGGPVMGAQVQIDINNRRRNGT
jgi:hypothetical protein